MTSGCSNDLKKGKAGKQQDFDNNIELDTFEEEAF